MMIILKLYKELVWFTIPSSGVFCSNHQEDSMETFNNLNNMDPTSIQVPFPPRVSVSRLVEKRLQAPAHSKSPNSFFIYRKAFLDEARTHNCKVKMTEISPIISESWKQQPPYVKNVYREIAKEVERLSVELRQNARINAARRQHVVLPSEETQTTVMSQIPSFTTNISYENYGRLVPSQPLDFNGFSINFPNHNQFYQMIPILQTPPLENDINYFINPY
ncbi:MATA-HMG [Gigaspora margarita]|uniref:MATA-HMG n=1 Tax=Gigaspora margarita TaxID=4874 RepID=A0A8H3XCW4_GIGMA|nr:MATA-HMG [Gigaspora margarita]